MASKRGRYVAPSATPWDDVPEGSISASARVVRDAHRSAYRIRHAPVGGPDEAAFFNSYERDRCIFCGGDIARRGHDAHGIRRWQCKSCGRSFGPQTGTIFEDRKVPVSEWVEFVLQMVSFDSLSEAARGNRTSPTTSRYWAAKLFAVLGGVQDGVVLSGDVQCDEKLYPVAGRDAARRADGALLRGASRNKLCIHIACETGRRDARSVFVHNGLGKTSSARTWEALGGHIAEGSRLTHDRERAHGVLVRRLGLVSEAHSSRDLKGLADADNPLYPVNRLCFLVETFLNAHSGFDRSDIQGWLGIFWVAMNPPANKMEKVGLVLDRAMSNPKTVRYRDFYNIPHQLDGLQDAP